MVEDILHEKKRVLATEICSFQLPLLVADNWELTKIEKFFSLKLSIHVIIFISDAIFLFYFLSFKTESHS